MPDRTEVMRILQNIHDNADLGADLIAAAGWALDALNNSTEVVRCRDCVHWSGPDKFSPYFGDPECPCNCSDGFFSWLPDPDWYCANGERRTEPDGT